MHVAAANPQYLDIASVDAKALDRERDVLREQARASRQGRRHHRQDGRGPAEKFYEEIVLLEQIFVIDGETRVSKVLEQAAKEVGAPVKIAAFARSRWAKASTRAATISPPRSPPRPRSNASPPRHRCAAAFTRAADELRRAWEKAPG